MPRYDYKCESGHFHEETHSIKESPEVVCPECHAPCARVIGAVPSIFKGNGWIDRDMRRAKEGRASQAKAHENFNGKKI